MIMRTMSILTLALCATAGPLLAQRPGFERLQELRLHRLRTAVELDQEQAKAVEESMEAVRRAERDARERERTAIERIRTALRDEPVNQDAIRESLEALEREREGVARVRREQAERLKQRLSPEQQAKLLFFNRQFDQRLRELMAHRRGPAMGPEMRRGPGMRGPGPRGRALRGPDVPPERP
jgi:Spy/CpxP family protein refolding chaperone